MGLDTPVVYCGQLQHFFNKILAEVFHLDSTIARLKSKGFGGSLYEKWNMQFNQILHLNLTETCNKAKFRCENTGIFSTSVAWLLSALVARFMKERNFQNIFVVFLYFALISQLFLSNLRLLISYPLYLRFRQRNNDKSL